MYKDEDLDAYEQLIKASRELFPHRYFVTTSFPDWSIVDRLGKPIHQIAFSDAKVLSRYSKSHLYPLIGFNEDRTRKCHFHTIYLAEKPLNFEALHKFHDNREMDVQKYDGRRDCLVYTGRKHTPFYQREVIHPRMKTGCSCHQCKWSLALRPHIPK